MPNYRRVIEPGGKFFFTLVTHERYPLFADTAARRLLKDAITTTRRERRFDLVAAVLLPDHLHLILTLAPGDADFSSRIAAIKARFTRSWLTGDRTERAQTPSRDRQGHRGVWQKRLWEHYIRDEPGLSACCDYIHYNPVRHGQVRCPHDWEWSTFHRFVAKKQYPKNWLCRCDDQLPFRKPPQDLTGAEGDS